MSILGKVTSLQHTTPGEGDVYNNKPLLGRGNVSINSTTPRRGIVRFHYYILQRYNIIPIKKLSPVLFILYLSSFLFLSVSCLITDPSFFSSTGKHSLSIATCNMTGKNFTSCSETP